MTDLFAAANLERTRRIRWPTGCARKASPMWPVKIIFSDTKARCGG
jgi:hypothetical protein